jgi:hypothetical protein
MTLSERQFWRHVLVENSFSHNNFGFTPLSARYPHDYVFIVASPENPPINTPRKHNHIKLNILSSLLEEEQIIIAPALV